MQDYLKRHEEKHGVTSAAACKPDINPFKERDPTQTGGLASSSTVGQMSSGAANQNSRSSGQQILVMLLRLRQCCSHLSLMKDVS